MNHFDEVVCLLYLEGQLEPPRAQELAVHAGECAQCRALLHALEHESRVLAAALTEENEPMPARLLSMRGSGAPSWVWTLAFGLFIAGASGCGDRHDCSMARSIEQRRFRWNRFGEHASVQRSILGRME